MQASVADIVGGEPYRPKGSKVKISSQRRRVSGFCAFGEGAE